MAKNTTEAEVIVTLNGATARNELKRLEAEIQNYEKAAADAYKAGDKALGDKMAKQAKALSKDLSISKKEMKDFSDVIKHLNTKSINELKSAAKQLQSQISKLTPGTQEFIEKSKQLQQVNARLNSLKATLKEVNAEQNRSALSIKSLADGFNKYFGMVTAGIAAITGLSMAFRKCAEEAAKLDDVYADVMKTTGLLHEEVQGLDKELMKIDTRTSREQLLLLARDAGKLGIQGKENILGFVRAADQIQVALGEDLGEDAVKQLGKIADVLGYTKSMGVEKALLSIGSAINAVGQDSTASEAYLVEFTQRLAGVAAQANISAADLIGFASGLDQSAMKVEMAATAFQKFLMKLYEDPAKFAEYAKMEVQEFSNLLKKDASTAITTVLKALNEQGGFDSLVKTFDEMGLDGARAVTVLSSMAANLNAVTEAQELANVEFEKATSVTNEFAVKNNTLQAQLEKARKEFQTASTTLGQSLNPIMLKSTKLLTYLIKLLASHGKEIRNAIIAVAALTAAIKAQAIADTIRTTGLKAWNTVSKTAEFLSNKLFAAYYRLTGQTLKYAAAQRAANAAASKSVYGLIAIAVGALVFKLTELNNKMKENVEVTEKAQTTEEKISETYAEEKGRIDALNRIINDNNVSLDKRKAALLELKEIVPAYHADLTEEGVLINNNTTALDAYLVKLRQKIKLEAYKEDFKEAEKAIKAYEDKIEEAEQKKQELVNANGGVEPEKQKKVRKEPGNSLLGQWLGIDLPSTSGVITYENQPTEYGQLFEDIASYEDGIEKLRKKQDDLMKRLGITMEAEKKEMETEIELTRKSYDELIKKALVNEVDPGKAERLKKERDETIANIRKKYEDATKTEVKENAILTQAQFDFLKDRYDKLTKKEKAMMDKGYASLSDEESKALKARYTKLTKVAINEENKRYNAELKALDAAQRSEENELKQSLLNQQISQANFNAQMNLLQMKYLQKRIETAKKYGQDETKYISQLLDEEIKLIGEGTEELQEAMVSLDPKSDIVDPKAYENFWNEIYKKRDSIVANLQNVSLKTEYDTEMQWLNKLHEQELLSEEEFQDAKLQLRLEYASKGAQKLASISEEASNIITAIREAESAQLEAQYQKDLTAAGDNAERREEIEAEYEEKQLELKKKYADVDMAINIAKTIASGAVAAIRAYAEGGPYAGVILAALIAATTAAEVATIVAQRNAIKATSVNSSSTSSVSNTNTIETGTRTMTGYSGGGFTDSDASDAKPVGIVHANEWVAPAPLVRKNPVLFRNLENYRLANSRGRSPLNRGFADGGFTTIPTGSAAASAMAVEEIDWQAIRDFNELLRYCSTHGLFVKFGDILIAKAKYETFKKETSR